MGVEVRDGRLFKCRFLGHMQTRWMRVAGGGAAACVGETLLHTQASNCLCVPVRPEAPAGVWAPAQVNEGDVVADLPGGFSPRTAGELPLGVP